MKPIKWTVLKPGDMCIFQCGDSRDGLVEILNVFGDLGEIEFQKLNGKYDHHGCLTLTAYIDCFYELE